MLFLRASQFLLTRKIFKIFPNWIPILTFLKNCVILTESGVWQAQWDQSCQRWQKSTKDFANLSCLFEGSVYFDKIFYTLLACLRVRYILMIFYTHFKTACISLLHIWLIFFTLHHFMWVYRISSWHSSCGVCRSLWPRSIDGSCRRSRWWL